MVLIQGPVQDPIGTVVAVDEGSSSPVCGGALL